MSHRVRVGDAQRVRATGMRTLGALLVLAPKVMAAEGGECVHVEVDGQPPAAWAGAIADLRARLATTGRSDCVPMQLSLVLSEDDGRIVATTRDGRRTERRVRRPDALVATALGLTAGIPADQLTPEPAPPPAKPASAPDATPAPGASATLAPPAAPAPPGLALGLSGGVRLTAPTAAAAVDVEGRADLRIGPWLVLATVRSALFSCIGQQGLDCDAYTDVGGGIGLGRTFRAGAGSVDVAFEPTILAMHMEVDAPASEGTFVEQTELALFLDAAARLLVPIGKKWALTLTVDGAVAPSLLVNPIQVSLPPGETGESKPVPFPAWMGGVRLGALGAIL